MATPQVILDPLSEVLEQVLELLVGSEPKLVPWHSAMQRLKDGDVEGAAEMASKAFAKNGLDNEHAETCMTCIVNMATNMQQGGHWIETLLQQGAGAGLLGFAYNAANNIKDRASSPADYALADRYYQQAIKFSSDPCIQASALVNSCEAVRDGLITGQPNWPRSVEIYEQAGELNLAVGMFNAGNVSCWLCEQGDYKYADRAASWFKRLIERYEAGGEFVDLGGKREVREVYRKAKFRLAWLHAREDLKETDIDLVLRTGKEHLSIDTDEAKWLLRQGYTHRLRKTLVKAKREAWQNWHSALSLMDWELAEEPSPLPPAMGGSIAYILKYKRANGAPLLLAVVNQDETELNHGVYRLARLAKELQATHDGPCFAIGAKGLFIGVKENWYTVLVSSTSQEGSELIPIWPGATADEVTALVGKGLMMYEAVHSDDGNTIPILVNALGTGRKVDGVNFPHAIYINVGEMFHTPILTPRQARTLGSSTPERELKEAFEGVKKYWEEQGERKRRHQAT